METSGLALVLDNEETKKFWAGLWRLNVPNKIKTFAWRACTDLLPPYVGKFGKAKGGAFRQLLKL